MKYTCICMIVICVSRTTQSSIDHVRVPYTLHHLHGNKAALAPRRHTARILYGLEHAHLHLVRGWQVEAAKRGWLWCVAAAAAASTAALCCLLQQSRSVSCRLLQRSLVGLQRLADILGFLLPYQLVRLAHLPFLILQRLCLCLQPLPLKMPLLVRRELLRRGGRAHAGGGEVRGGCGFL